MRYVSAYLLATLGGNDSPSENDIKTILESVGVSYDCERAKVVVAQLKGKSLSELVEEGTKKMASMPSGGGATAPAAGGGAAAAGGAAAQEEKKEEKKEESADESDDDMGFGLFD